MSNGLLAVTGATGEVGGRVARRLAERGLEQRLVVRDPSRAPELEGAEVARASNYEARDEMEAALKGAHALFLVSGEEARNRVEQHKAAVDAAKAAGVERIVYLSWFHASPDTAFTFGRHHFHTEEHIRASGLSYAFSRDNIYLDYLPFFAGADGVIRGPGGDGRFAPVSRDDVAEVVVELLTNPDRDGQAYEVSGPESYTLPEAAERLGRAIGREVAYVDETMEEAWASRRPSGEPDWVIEGWITTYVAIAKGELAEPTTTVKDLTGHEPMRLEQFLERHPESYEHLVGSSEPT
jgi:NAD(P)H dehydrogenase (quinone)